MLLNFLKKKKYQQEKILRIEADYTAPESTEYLGRLPDQEVSSPYYKPTATGQPY
jgi:hypothetical protein